MEFICRRQTTYDTEDWFDSISTAFEKDDIRSAILRYDKRYLTDYDAPKEKAPLTMFGKTKSGKPIAIYIFAATAGYGGSGPHMSYDILKKAGFDVKFEQIENNFKDYTYLTFHK